MSVWCQDLIDRARAQGWKVEWTGGNHLRFYPSDRSKPVVHASGTASDKRALLNLRADLRKSGLRCD